MPAERKIEIERPIVRRKKKKNRAKLLRSLICNRMICVLALAIAVSFVLIVYVSAYARATQTGYERDDLLLQLRSIKLENQSLKLQRDGKRSPDVIAQFAAANQMEPSARIAWVKPVEQPNVASSKQ